MDSPAGSTELKFLVLGDAGVGKSTAILSFLRGKFIDEPCSTGMYHTVKKLVQLNDARYLLSLIDCEDWRDVPPEDWPDVCGVCIMYRAERRRTFYHVRSIVKVVARHFGTLDFPIVVAGNCFFTPKREVSEAMLRRFANDVKGVPIFDLDIRSHPGHLMVVFCRLVELALAYIDKGRTRVDFAPRDERLRRLLVSEARITFVDSELQVSPASRADTPLDGSEILFAGPSKVSDSVQPGDAEQKGEGDVDVDVLTERGDVRKIRAATLDKLVERLTYHKYPETSFAATFLLTFRSFCTPSLLLSLLFKRYCIEPPPNASQRQVEDFTVNKQIPVKLRVFNVLKMWIENYYEDFSKDAILAATLASFVESVMKKQNSSMAVQLLRLMKKKEDEEERGTSARLSTWYATDPPKSVGVKGLTIGKFDVLDINPLEFARQLAIYEFKLFSKVPAPDFVSIHSAALPDPEKAHHLKRLLDHSHTLTMWVAGEVVKVPKLQTRAALLKAFLSIASDSLELGNIHGAVVVASGLMNVGVHRLKQSWELVPAPMLRRFKALGDLVNRRDNFQKLRELVGQLQSPCVPFVGMYMQDVSRIESTNPDYVKEGADLVNFHKRVLLAEVVKEVVRFQYQPFNLRPVDPILHFIDGIVALEEESIYRMSLGAEVSTTAQKKLLKFQHASSNVNLPFPSSSPGVDPAFLPLHPRDSRRGRDEQPAGDAAAKRVAQEEKHMSEKSLSQSVRVIRRLEAKAKHSSIQEWLEFWSGWSNMFDSHVTPTGSIPEGLSVLAESGKTGVSGVESQTGTLGRSTSLEELEDASVAEKNMEDVFRMADRVRRVDPSGPAAGRRHVSRKSFSENVAFFKSSEGTEVSFEELFLQSRVLQILLERLLSLDRTGGERYTSRICSEVSRPDSSLDNVGSEGIAKAVQQVMGVCALGGAQFHAEIVQLLRLLSAAASSIIVAPESTRRMSASKVEIVMSSAVLRNVTDCIKLFEIRPFPKFERRLLDSLDEELLKNALSLRELEEQEGPHSVVLCAAVAKIAARMAKMCLEKFRIIHRTQGDAPRLRRHRLALLEVFGVFSPDTFTVLEGANVPAATSAANDRLLRLTCTCSEAEIFRHLVIPPETHVTSEMERSREEERAREQAADDAAAQRLAAEAGELTGREVPLDRLGDKKQMKKEKKRERKAEKKAKKEQKAALKAGRPDAQADDEVAFELPEDAADDGGTLLERRVRSQRMSRSPLSQSAGMRSPTSDRGFSYEDLSSSQMMDVNRQRRLLGSLFVSFARRALKQAQADAIAHDRERQKRRKEFIFVVNVCVSQLKALLLLLRRRAKKMVEQLAEYRRVRDRDSSASDSRREEMQALLSGTRPEGLKLSRSLSVESEVETCEDMPSNLRSQSRVGSTPGTPSDLELQLSSIAEEFSDSDGEDCGSPRTISGGPASPRRGKTQASKISSLIASSSPESGFEFHNLRLTDGNKLLAGVLKVPLPVNIPKEELEELFGLDLGYFSLVKELLRDLEAHVDDFLEQAAVGSHERSAIFDSLLSLREFLVATEDQFPVFRKSLDDIHSLLFDDDEETESRKASDPEWYSRPCGSLLRDPCGDPDVQGLIDFPPAAVYREGELLGFSTKSKAWEQRFVVLNGRVLRCYLSQEDHKLGAFKSELVLSSSTMMYTDSRAFEEIGWSPRAHKDKLVRRQNVFLLSSGAAAFLFLAPSEGDMYKWLVVLQQALSNARFEEERIAASVAAVRSSTSELYDRVVGGSALEVGNQLKKEIAVGYVLVLNVPENVLHEAVNPQRYSQAVLRRFVSESLSITSTPPPRDDGRYALPILNTACLMGTVSVVRQLLMHSLCRYLGAAKAATDRGSVPRDNLALVSAAATGSSSGSENTVSVDEPGVGTGTQLARCYGRRTYSFGERDKLGMTALHHAVNNSRLDLVQVILSIDESNELIRAKKGAAARTENQNAVRKDAADLLFDSEALHLYEPLDVNVQDRYGQTPLHYAAGHGNVKILHMLLQRGADIGILTHQKVSVIHLLSASGAAEPLRHVLLSGLPNLDLNVATAGERLTSLHYCAISNNLLCARMLLEWRGLEHALQQVSASDSSVAGVHDPKRFSVRTALKSKKFQPGQSAIAEVTSDLPVLCTVNAQRRKAAAAIPAVLPKVASPVASPVVETNAESRDVDDGGSARRSGGRTVDRDEAGRSDSDPVSEFWGLVDLTTTDSVLKRRSLPSCLPSSYETLGVLQRLRPLLVEGSVSQQRVFAEVSLPKTDDGGEPGFVPSHVIVSGQDISSDFPPSTMTRSPSLGGLKTLVSHRDSEACAVLARCGEGAATVEALTAVASSSAGASEGRKSRAASDLSSAGTSEGEAASRLPGKDKTAAGIDRRGGLPLQGRAGEDGASLDDILATVKSDTANGSEAVRLAPTAPKHVQLTRTGSADGHDPPWRRREASMESRSADVKARDGHGRTALHFATARGLSDMCVLLLHYDASCWTYDISGFSPLFLAIRNHSEELMRLYFHHISAVANPKALGMDRFVCPQTGISAIHVAAEFNLEPKLFDFVVRKTRGMLKINEPTLKGETPLHFAVKHNNFELVKHMIGQHGAGIMILDDRGWSCLHYAVEVNSLEIASYLMNLIFRMDQVPQQPSQSQGVAFEDDDAPLEMSYSSLVPSTSVAAGIGEVSLSEGVNSGDRDGTTALHLVAVSGNLDLLRLLLKKGARADVVNKWTETPLGFACRNGHVQAMNLLLEFGAEPHTQDRNGDTALHLAAKYGQLLCVRRLLERASDLLDVLNATGCSALHTAAEAGEVSIVKILLERRADISILDRKGCSVLHKAALGGNAECVKLILERMPTSLDEFCNLRDVEGNNALQVAAMKYHLQCLELIVGKMIDVNQLKRLQAAEPMAERDLETAAAASELALGAESTSQESTGDPTERSQAGCTRPRRYSQILDDVQ